MSYIMIFKMFGKVVKKCMQRDTTVIFNRALLKAQTTGIMTACVTMNKKVNKIT